MDYPSEYIEQVVLRDGARVTLRPIRPDDASRLQTAFARLSLESVYMRFLEAMRELSDEQARAYATVDYLERMALVGIVEEDGEERVVVSARYALIGASRPGVAEVAIVVRDDYQRRGLGNIVMNRLARYARRHGVTTFLGTIHVSNARILRFIQRSSLKFEKEMIEPGVWEILIDLGEGD